MARKAIFISYRRDDSAEDAAALHRALAARLGASNLFKDVDDIPLGADFGAHIGAILPRCQTALILIGPSWAQAVDDQGRRRLEDGADWVRREAELALAAEAAGGLRVVPVLVNGARMPRADEVPASLAALVAHNAAALRRGPDFESDAARLIAALALVVAPETIAIPAGEFVMGSPPHEKGREPSEGPQRRVSVKAFELGIYPVTFADWDAAAAAGAVLHQADDRKMGRDRRPVVNVSWSNAQAYIAWLNSKTAGGYRLPSEAEWEYACRAGTTSPYATGEDISESQARFAAQSSAPVGSYAPNAFGLYDMHGNVWEWCEDVWRPSYEGAPQDGAAWIADPSTRQRVIRGGAWSDQSAHLRSAARGWESERVGRNSAIGFRVARDL